MAGTDGASGSTTVTVTLNVTAPLPTITKVTNAASYAAAGVSPGEIITLFASDPAHPIGPATPVGLTLDSTGNVSTSIGGVQVTVNGFACPMIYASASQVSAVVPYEIKQFISANVVVKFLGQTSNGVAVNVVTTVAGIVYRQLLRHRSGSHRQFQWQHQLPVQSGHPGRHRGGVPHR